MKIWRVKEIIKLLEADGWFLYRHKGTSHRKFKHLVKKGSVTVPGNSNDELAPKTATSILAQAGLIKN